MTQSLYRCHPFGNLLVRVTKTENADAKGDAQPIPGFVKLIVAVSKKLLHFIVLLKGSHPLFSLIKIKYKYSPVCISIMRVSSILSNSQSYFLF